MDFHTFAINKMVNRCSICQNYKSIFKNTYKDSILFKPENINDFFHHCKFSYRKEKGLDNYEKRHQNWDNRNPHSVSEHLEDDNISLTDKELDLYHMNRKVPYCQGFKFRYNKFTNSKFTQLSLAGKFPVSETLSNEEKSQWLNKIFQVKQWSKMTKINNKWEPLLFKHKMNILNKLRTKFDITKWIPEIYKKLEEQPTLAKPKTPIIDLMWPFLSNDMKELYTKWSRKGDKYILSEIADKMLEPMFPECTEEYINTGKHKNHILSNGEWIPFEKLDKYSYKMTMEIPHENNTGFKKFLRKSDIY